MSKALATTGVFGLPAKILDGNIRIKVNVRTDQERQWQLAKLEPIAGVQIVDCPGGGLQQGEDFEKGLRREIREETGDCEIKFSSSLKYFSKPYSFFGEGTAEKPNDYAFWAPIVLLGDSKPSNEALAHPWISFEEFLKENPYRCVGGLGNKGRTGQMLRSAFMFYEQNRGNPDLFS